MGEEEWQLSYAFRTISKQLALCVKFNPFSKRLPPKTLFEHLFYSSSKRCQAFQGRSAPCPSIYIRSVQRRLTNNWAWAWSSLFSGQCPKHRNSNWPFEWFEIKIHEQWQLMSQTIIHLFKHLFQELLALSYQKLAQSSKHLLLALHVIRLCWSRSRLFL